MPQLISPSQLIQCTDLSSCFQALYNFGFTIFLALSFLYFVYGAFQYLLSGAGVFAKEEGKKRMINSIIAVIIVLIIPLILNLINPEIFKAELYIPKITIKGGINFGLIEISEKNLSDEEINKRILTPTRQTSIGPVERRISFYDPDWRWEKVFADTKLNNISIVGNDPEGTEYINPKLKNIIIEFDRKLGAHGLKVKVTDGYSYGDHAGQAHTVYGTALDIVVVDKQGDVIAPVDKSWDQVINIARETGFWVLDERYLKGSSYSSGAHLHLEVR